MVNLLQGKYIKFAIVAIIYILVVVWIGNYWLLLGLGIIYDLYMQYDRPWYGMSPHRRSRYICQGILFWGKPPMVRETSALAQQNDYRIQVRENLFACACIPISLFSGFFRDFFLSLLFYTTNLGRILFIIHCISNKY